MGCRGSKEGDDSEILGRISKISTSPSGGKRLEVEASFKSKVEMQQTHLPFYMQSSGLKNAGARTKTIKLDMSPEEAKNLKEDDEIRARIREKYSSENRAGSCGMGASGDIYVHLETLGKENGGSAPKRGGGSSKWDRFKG